MSARRTATPRRAGRAVPAGAWAHGLVAVTLALAALLVAAPARAATEYRIDSVAGCQQFLTAMGADIGSAEAGRCTVASQGSEIHLPVGDSLVVARGWELSVRSVVLFNEGSIWNYGRFGAVGDVVNNVGGALFVNRGRVTIQQGSAMNVLDDAIFANRRGAKLDTVYLFDGATVVNRGTIRVGLLTVADWYDAVLWNFGRILVTCGGSVSGPVLGHPPIQLGHRHGDLCSPPRTPSGR